MHAAAERSDLRAGFVGARQQLQGGQRSLLGPVFVFDAMAAARLAQMLAQELPGVRVQQADLVGIPLHLDAPADPARRRAVVGRFDFHAAIQMHRALAVLVVAERLHGQRLQRRPLFGEHGGDLPLGGAVDARVGPARLPSGPGRSELPPGFRSEVLSEGYSWHGRRLFPPSPCDPDRATRQGSATTS